MTKVMTPSESITVGQIGKLQEIFGAALRKSALPSDTTQQVIETQGDRLVAELLAVVRKRVEAINGMIFRRVNVNIDDLPRQVLESTGRKLYVTDNVVKAMPRDQNPEAGIYFFKLDLKGGWISDDDLEKEYELRGLKPACPYALAAVNESDPAFADEQPNCTHWKDKDGRWCYAAFNRWSVERRVDVDQGGGGWFGHWFFAGVRK